MALRRSPGYTQTDRCVPDVFYKQSDAMKVTDSWKGCMAPIQLWKFLELITDFETKDLFTFTELRAGLTKLIVPSRKARGYFHLSTSPIYHLPPLVHYWQDAWDKTLPTLSLLLCFFTAFSVSSISLACKFLEPGFSTLPFPYVCLWQILHPEFPSVFPRSDIYTGSYSPPPSQL